uniref:Uncharacterized protein n=3 Tax=Meloidogyne TaxID=189290 RepID=A0A915N1N4_MELJA
MPSNLENVNIEASPQRNGYNCLTSLTIFVLSASSSLKYFQTIYNPLNQAGQLNFEQVPQKFLIDSQPSAIAVLVYNLGPQIDSDGSLYETNTVTLVDSFIQPLNLFSGYSSDIRGQQSVNLIGEILGTQLSFTYSVSCAGGISRDGRRLMGPGCDLNCNTTSITSNNAICENVKTGYFSQCKWTNGGNLDVTNCQNCPFGVKNNAYCADEQGGVLYGEVVSTFYYNGFIILCLVSEKERKKIKCEEDFNSKLAQKIEEQTEDNNELSQINSEQLLQITEQLLFNNLVEINKEGRKLSQNNSEKMEQQQNPQPEDSFALKPGEDLDVELKKAKLEYFRMQLLFNNLVEINSKKMEKQKEPPSLKDSVALKPGEDMDTELKKAKLEYFRIQTILAEEQISNLKIQRKVLELEYEEKAEKKRREERVGYCY